jgi:hypothetical protein
MQKQENMFAQTVGMFSQSSYYRKDDQQDQKKSSRERYMTIP